MKRLITLAVLGAFCALSPVYADFNENQPSEAEVKEGQKQAEKDQFKPFETEESKTENEADIKKEEEKAREDELKPFPGSSESR